MAKPTTQQGLQDQKVALPGLLNRLLNKDLNIYILFREFSKLGMEHLVVGEYEEALGTSILIQSLID